MSGELERLRALQGEIQNLVHTIAILSWDQETYMPPGAIEGRAEQLSMLQGLAHDRMTAPEIGELLDRLGADEGTPEGSGAENEVERALVRETFRAYRRETALPRDLVVALARQTSLAQARWVKAREKSDFSLFREPLAELIRLTLEKTEAIGYAQDPYDALLDDYEPWMTTEQVAAVFGPLERDLAKLVQEIGASGVKPADLKGDYPLERQRRLSERMLADLGFDLERGRLDVSAHPFSTTLGPGDTRVTTRFDEEDLRTSLFGTIHECGHGLYEQGIGKELHGTILADGTSLGIHESQSRFWENIVGRSRAFWSRYFPVLRESFPAATAKLTEEDFYRGINAVQPSFIRVEADEVTYSLHIILRFNLERRLIRRELQVDDLPDAWREESRKLLGIVPENDSDGVLQDIHWSMGAFGYFPTYALGNLYAAQFARALEQDLAPLDPLVRSGRFGEILGWLREKIHRHGRVYPAAELCRRVAGETLDPAHYIGYLREKYGPLYDL